MLVLSTPLLSMKTFNRGLDELPANAEVRVATERRRRSRGRLRLAGTRHHSATRPSASRRRVAAMPGRRATSARRCGAATARAGSSTLRLDAQPESQPPATPCTASSARPAPARSSAGSTVFDLDVQHAIFGGLWKMLLFILAACYVVLLLLLRSVVLPLKAVLMNLLSVGASYGVLVAVFQWGWLDWTGYRSPGYVDTIVPALVLAVTFGLSMDYEVFLLTRIRERWLAHGDNERAVAEGLVGSARIITSAAAVMVAVFAALRRRRRAVAEGARRRARGRDPPRRDARAARDRPGRDAPPRRLELVAAAPARRASCPAPARRTNLTV